MRALRRPSRSRTGFSRSATEAAAFAGLDPTTSSMSCSRATIPARASAGTATATSSSKSSASRSDTPATLRFRQPHRTGFKRASLEVAAALGLSAVGRVAARLGAQHRARRSAALLDHLPHAVGEGPAHRRSNRPRERSVHRNGSSAMRAVAAVRAAARRLLEGPRGRPAVHQPGAIARRRMGAGQ